METIPGGFLTEGPVSTQCCVARIRACELSLKNNYDRQPLEPQSRQRDMHQADNRPVQNNTLNANRTNETDGTSKKRRNIEKKSLYNSYITRMARRL